MKIRMDVMCCMWFGVLELYVFTHDESPCPASQAGGQVFDIDYNIPKALVIEDIDELLKANTENND